MAWLGDREFWLNLIGYASIVSAAIFGLLALFTDYKKEGKITRWGRLYAGGIALSAVFAMTSSVLQKRIAADEAAAGAESARRQQERQQTQFDTQLDHLQRLNGQMAWVNENSSTILDRMTASLRTQARLLTSAQQGMLLTSRLGVQERENTGRVLRGLWDETNRISANSVVVNLTFTCMGRGPGNLPALFPQGSGVVAELILWHQGDEERIPPRSQWVASDRFDRTKLILHAPDGGVHLTSIAHQPVLQQTRTGDVAVNGQAVRFASFSGDISRYAYPESWRDLFVELRLSVQQPGAIEQFRAFRSSLLQLDRRALERQHTFPDIPSEARLTGLPCTWVSASVEINDRTVVELSGVFIAIQMNDHDDGGIFGLFPFERVRQNVFPRYGGARQSTAARAPRHGN